MDVDRPLIVASRSFEWPPVTIPDVGQGHGDSQAGHSHDGHGHSHGTPGEREIVAEVHLGNLEVYP